MKKILWLLTAIAVMFGGQALVAPAASAAEITVTSTATSTASAKINSTTRVTINGAHQVSWQRPSKYKNIRLTKRNVQRAPVVRVDMSFSSAKLYRKSRGAKFVRVVGTWRNTGRYGNITAGFPTTARQPGMLMVFNSKTRKYEHGYTLKYPSAVKKTDLVKFYTSVKVAGKWRRVAVVVSCFNDFFGKVQKTFRSVVQYVLEGDVIEEAEVSAQADANAKATASGSCPDGTTVTAEATASASASAMAKIRYRIKYRLTSWNTKKAELITQVKASAEADAKASAEAKISIECGENPPTYETPSVDVSPVACVEPGQTRNVTVTVSNPNDIADTARVTYRGQTSEKAIAAHGQVTFTYANQAAGTYSGTALLVNASKSKSFTVTVEECDTPPPYSCPPGTTWTDIDKDGVREEGECFGPPTFTQFREFNDLYHSLPGQPTTMDHFVTVDTPAGHSYTITWEAVWGSFATPSKTGQDGVQVSSTYTAPSEVPPAHPEMGLSAGYDKIIVTVVDNVTGQRIVRSTAPFRIKAWPATP